MAAARGDSSISGPGGRRSALAWALAASVALHGALIFGVAVKPEPSAVKRPAVIAARLEQAAGTPAPPPRRAEPPLPPPEAAPHPGAVLRSAPLEKPVAEVPAAVAAAPGPPAGSEAAAKPALDIPLLEDPAYYPARQRSEEHTSELQSPKDLVCRLLLEKKK